MAACGTAAGYYQHLKNLEPTCPECRAALNTSRKSLHDGTRKPKKKQTDHSNERSIPCPRCGADAGAFCVKPQTRRPTYDVCVDRHHAYEASVA